MKIQDMRSQKKKSRNVWQSNFVVRAFNNHRKLFLLGVVLVLMSALAASQFFRQGSAEVPEAQNFKVVAVPVDEDERPPLVKGSRVDLFLTDEEGMTRQVAGFSTVFNVEERAVSLIVADGELSGVVAALALASSSDAHLALVLTS